MTKPADCTCYLTNPDLCPACEPSPAGEGAQETLGQACCRPAPDRSGRSCDKPKGHGGEHWSYGGGGISWQADVAPSLPPERAALVERLNRQAVSKQGELDSLKSIPDNRAWEDGSRLNLDIRMDRLSEEIRLLREAAVALTGERGRD